MKKLSCRYRAGTSVLHVKSWCWWTAGEELLLLNCRQKAAVVKLQVESWSF